jgi:phosphatidylglycerophosphate synthase
VSEVAPRHNPKLARWADLLTGGRILMALPLGVAGYGGNITATAVLLSLAWWSDFLDGRLARRAGGGTRLSGWDLGADTLVGAGLMTGLVAGGHILVPWGVAAALLGLGYIAFDNPSLGMLLQAIAYGSALWLAAGQATFGLVVAVATIAAITILSLPRLFGYLLPTFFRGLLGKVDKESDDGPDAR